jgi:uncharacterized protein (TIGR00730 family)
MKSVAVFCGSNVGTNGHYREQAEALGAEMARRRMALVYGGGKVGLMGAIADAVLASGGEVIGVMPQALMDKEIGHRGISELIVTTSMHERKAVMEARAEGFIALPGGFGTLDEFCEILTWAQLGYHAKPCGLLDTDGFFAQLLAFFDSAVERGFIQPAHRQMLIEAAAPADLLDRMEAFIPSFAPKWTDPGVIPSRSRELGGTPTPEAPRLHSG